MGTDCLQNECITYLISLLISLFACIIFALIQQLFTFGAKKRIQLDIEYIQGCSWQLEQALSFGDYRTAVEQADNIEKSIIHIYDNIRFFTYGTYRKRKLFNTYTYNVFRFTDQVKFIALGYDDTEEYKARCEKLYGYLNNPQGVIYRNWLQDSIYMMSLLNDKKGICEPIRLYVANKTHKSLCNVIEVNTFKTDTAVVSFKKEVMTQEEYLKCVKRYIKYT